MRFRACAIIFFAVFRLLRAAPALAHDETVSTSTVVITGDIVTWTVDVGVAGLAKEITLPAAELELSEDDLPAIEALAGPALAADLELVADGRLLVGVPVAIAARYEPHVASGRPYLARVALELRYRAAAPIDVLVARVRFFSKITRQHRAIVKVRFGSEQRQFVRLGPTELRLERGRLHPTIWTTAWDFLRWGTWHIFVGYDHIAFLLALLLAVVRLRDLFGIVTAFTVAHSATILLASLGLLHVPPRLTEVLIAASIVFVAAENLLSRGAPGPRRRFVVAFVFGLVHGLGFAAELRARLSEVAGGVLLPVLSFNLGVETGQLAIVCVAFPLLARLRRTPTLVDRPLRARRLMQVGSLPILFFGLFWLIERLLG